MKLLFITGQGFAIRNCIDNICSEIGGENHIITVEISDEFQPLKVLKSGQWQCKLVYENIIEKFGPSTALREIQERIVELYNHFNYDAIFTCSGYFAVHDLIINIPELHNHWYIYLVDPYSFNKNLSVIKNDIERRIEREKKLFECCRAVFVTPKMYEEYFFSDKFKVFRNKIIQTDLPMIKKIKDKQCETIYRNTDEINLVYAGGFYPSIRTPDYMFKIIKRLPNNIILYIAGNMPNRYRIQIMLDRKLSRHVRYLGKISRLELMQVYQSADALVNIGNSIDNQLPSKLLEYFSVGKPIINFYKIVNCYTLMYTSKYPCAINLFEKRPFSENVKKIRAFLTKNAGKTIAFDIVEKNFKMNTPSYVAELMLKTIINGIF